MPASLIFSRNVLRHQRAVGRQRGAQAAAGGVLGQLEDVVRDTAARRR